MLCDQEQQFILGDFLHSFLDLSGTPAIGAKSQHINVSTLETILSSSSHAGFLSLLKPVILPCVQKIVDFKSLSQQVMLVLPCLLC